NAFGNDLSFLVVAKGPQYLDLIAFLFFRKYVLLQLLLIIGDNAISYVDDILGGAIVLLQLKYFQVGIILFKIEDVLDIGPTEGIDTLGIIAHYTDIFVNRRQLFHNQVLRKI